MLMKKKHTFKGKLADHKDNNFVAGSVAMRIGMVWPLTQEIVSLSPKHNAEQRLQRHITRLKRRTG